MIAMIRIAGRVGIKKDVAETFERLNMKKKYSCIVFPNPTKIELGMMKRVKDHVAFGTINKEVYEKLVKQRGEKRENVFRLHPPRKGIKSKLHYPKGVLGNHGEKINDLILRML
jgi:large subunit ribosomal protein L30